MVFGCKRDNTYLNGIIISKISIMNNLHIFIKNQSITGSIESTL